MPQDGQVPTTSPQTPQGLEAAAGAAPPAQAPADAKDDVREQMLNIARAADEATGDETPDGGEEEANDGDVELSDTTRRQAQLAGLSEDDIRALGSDKAVERAATRAIESRLAAGQERGAGPDGEDDQPVFGYEPIAAPDLPAELREQFGDEVSGALQSFMTGFVENVNKQVSGLVERLNQYDQEVMLPVEQAHERARENAGLQHIGQMISKLGDPELEREFGSGPVDGLAKVQIENRRQILRDTSKAMNQLRQAFGDEARPEDALRITLRKHGYEVNSNAPPQPRPQNQPPQPDPAPRRGTPLGRPNPSTNGYAPTPSGASQQHPRVSERELMNQRAKELGGNFFG